MIEGIGYRQRFKHLAKQIDDLIERVGALEAEVAPPTYHYGKEAIARRLDIAKKTVDYHIKVNNLPVTACRKGRARIRLNERLCLLWELEQARKLREIREQRRGKRLFGA